MDLTTVGVKLGYAVEATAGTKPTTFTQLERCKKIGAIDLTTDKLDVTALEDLIKKYASGVADTGGEWSLTFGLSDSVVTDLTAAISASKTAKAAGKDTWFDIWLPDLAKSFFVKAEFGSEKMPMAEMGVSAVAEIVLSLVLNEYVGLDTAIEPS